MGLVNSVVELKKEKEKEAKPMLLFPLAALFSLPVFLQL